MSNLHRSYAVIDALLAENARLRLALYWHKHPPLFGRLWNVCSQVGPRDPESVVARIRAAATRSGLRVEQHRPEQEFKHPENDELVCCDLDCHFAMCIDDERKLHFALGRLAHAAPSLECAELRRMLTFLEKKDLLE